MSVEQHNGVLVVPEGFVTYRRGKPLQLATPEGRNAVAEFERAQRNFQTFYHIVQEGELLAQLLALTSHQSFLDGALSTAAQNADFANSVVKLIDGDDTSWSSIQVFLPQLAIYADFFTSTPIPENLEAVADAQQSLRALRNLLENKRDFYDKVKSGVAVPQVHDDGLRFGDLEVRVLANGGNIAPQRLKADASRIEVADQFYYNGLPSDRGLYPTVLLPEGSKLTLTINNTTGDKLYAVIPTINGIPFQVARLGFGADDFARTPLPVRGIGPHAFYIKPGETTKIERFFCNDVFLTVDSPRSYLSSMSDYDPGMTELGFLIRPVLEGQMSDGDRTQLDQLTDNPVLAERIKSHSCSQLLREFLEKLKRGARESDVYIRRPVIADGKASSQLDNPFLGSLGFVVLEVYPPPQKATHDSSFTSIDMRKSFGPFRGGGGDTLGIAGLAEIGGGPDIRVAKKDFWHEQWQFDSYLHRFVGYFPINVMSLRK